VRSKSVGLWTFYLSLLILPACHSGRLAALVRTAPDPIVTPNGSSFGSSSSVDKSSILRSTVIRYEATGYPTTLPLVRAEIAGRPTSMLLDSGATTHAIAGWLARTLSLPLDESPTDEVTDHDGRRVPAFRTESAKISLDQWGVLEKSSYLVVQVPAIFEQRDVGGILSPQLLAGDGESVLVDLKNQRISLERAIDAEAALEAVQGCLLTPAPAPACVDAPTGSADAQLFALEASVDNHSTRMTVDTGAVRSDLLGWSARRLADGGEAAFVLSGASNARVLADARLRVGDCEFVRSIDVIEGASGRTCSRAGSLGIDVLRSCTLLMNRERMLGRCEVP
jgi:Aspartyl protease